MFTAIVVSEVGRGCWVAEQDQTRDCIWIHQRFVVGRKFLHINDRIRFNLAPNPRKLGEEMAVDVEIVGLTLARQVSAPKSGGAL
jgi:hypothetical protein